MPPTFTSLPREIRDHIYEHCLIADEEIVPFPCKQRRTRWEIPKGGLALEHRHLDRKEARKILSLGLLRVNRQISDEAAQIYYSRNFFRLSRFDVDHITQFWLRYSHSFRYLVLGDEMESTVHSRRLIKIGRWLWLWKLPLRRHTDRYQSRFHINTMHSLDSAKYLETLRRKFEAVKDMKLKTLTIALHTLRCKIRACGLCKQRDVVIREGFMQSGRLSDWSHGPGKGHFGENETVVICIRLLSVRGNTSFSATGTTLVPR